MISADAPYYSGKDCGRGAADDRKGEAGYADSTRQWIALCSKLLTPDGSLWACVDHRCLRAVLNAVADAGLHQRGVVTWADPFAQYQPRNFTPGRFLVYATKHPKKYVFHGDAVAVPSKRQTQYADSRAYPAGRTPSGVWADISTHCGTFAERGRGETQLPVALVERPLRACTDVGDVVLDPFGGEGTTGVAAALHGRRCVLVERDRPRAERAATRLAAELGQ